MSTGRSSQFPEFPTTVLKVPRFDLVSKGKALTGAVINEGAARISGVSHCLTVVCLAMTLIVLPLLSVLDEENGLALLGRVNDSLNQAYKLLRPLMLGLLAIVLAHMCFELYPNTRFHGLSQAFNALGQLVGLADVCNPELPALETHSNATYEALLARLDEEGRGKTPRYPIIITYRNQYGDVDSASIDLLDAARALREDRLQHDGVNIPFESVVSLQFDQAKITEIQERIRALSSPRAGRRGAEEESTLAP